jgi:benzil reductase ((S)-benzoin forming)
MDEATKSIVWITGATSGIGEALSRTCPWPDTQIVSVSRREHPDHETILFDLTDMESWNRVGEHLTATLATFRGERAVFIHNALYYWGGRAYVGEGDPAHHRDEIIANAVAPLVLGDMFLRAAQPAVDAGVDCGLVQISSASARIAYPGLAIYGASKAAMEQWVRAVRAERTDRGKGPWVGAIRPGFVDTPAARRDAALPEDTYPGVAGIAEAVRTGNFLTAEESAANIWSSIPDDVIAKPVLLFGEAVGVTT